MRRDIWEKIGEFDERVSFWCSDDAVVEQLKAIDVMPVVVVASRVHHKVSATLRDEPNRDELTWKQVYIFNQLYNQRLGEDNERYLDWKRRSGVEA
jgi:GT2 family glycosyltransferase